MALTPGTRLGVYEVTAQIGVGGMGEVYRATDTKLKRQVAIKILPSSLAADPDRLARFQREAEVLASLNHPHIAAIYGLEDADGVKALVMELVEGDDLSQRIRLGAIPLDEALPIAKEIAEALEAAHEQGIIHRDLKPANVKVRPDGTVKVLDFGLAKAMEPTAGSSPSVSQSPTITTPAMTQFGMILGTAAYMSPEQARGKAADKRSDVWAFGCVLYEMLTGKRVFEGEDVSDTLAAVLRGEPDWDALATAAPPSIRSLIKRCLEKNRRERISDIAVVRFILDEPIAAAMSPPAVIATSRRRSAMLWKAATALALTTLGGLTGWYLARSATPEVTRFLVFPPEKNAFCDARLGLGYASAILSPDGRRLAFTAVDAGGRTLLWVRAITSLTAEPLAGTDDAATSLLVARQPLHRLFHTGKAHEDRCQRRSAAAVVCLPQSEYRRSGGHMEPSGDDHLRQWPWAPLSSLVDRRAAFATHAVATRTRFASLPVVLTGRPPRPLLR